MTSLVDDIYSAEYFERRVTERFESRRDILEAIGGDQRLNPYYLDKLTERSFKPAAVLFALTNVDGIPRVILTQRTEKLKSHSGQIALPGGKLDEGESPEQAALREAEEEIGLSRERVRLLGTFGTYYSGSGYAISPVVGIVKGTPKLVPNPDEVAEIFEVPLGHLMSEKNHKIESRVWQEKERFFYTIPYRDDQVAPVTDRRIWGVTAGIIQMIQERIYG